MTLTNKEENKLIARRLYVSATQMIPQIKKQIDELNQSLESIEKSLEVANELYKQETSE